MDEVERLEMELAGAQEEASTYYDLPCGCEIRIYLDMAGCEYGEVFYCPRHRAADEIYNEAMAALALADKEASDG